MEDDNWNEALHKAIQKQKEFIGSLQNVLTANS